MAEPKPREYNFALKMLRKFFDKEGFVESPVSHHLSILSACEDPTTIGTFSYSGNVWPLPQTGQMELEKILLSDPSLPGVYCTGPSYREEPNPIPGRHDLIFQMFEFETHGDMKELISLECKLLEFLGFEHGLDIKLSVEYYSELAARYNVKELSPDHEMRLWEQEKRQVHLLKLFPRFTSPFWNMRRLGSFAEKVDVILCGMESIGSAERSTNPEEMRNDFYTISNGKYAEILFGRFGKDRVERELNEFLSLNFFPRCGGGIGMTRLIRALKLAGIMPDFSYK